MTYNFGIAIAEDVIKYTYVWYESIEALDYIEEYRPIIKPKEITKDTLERGWRCDFTTEI